MKRVVPLVMAAAACGVFGIASCTPAPGFTADDDGATGPRLTVAADVAADGRSAVLHVAAHDLGEVLGLSAHVKIDGDAVAIDDVTAAPFFGGTDGGTDGGAVDGAVDGAGNAVRYVGKALGNDVALGGSHTTATSSAVADGEVATVSLHGVAQVESRVELVDALARQADGSFIPVAVAGGSIVLEVKP